MPEVPAKVLSRIVEVLNNAFSDIPNSTEPKSADPVPRVRTIGLKASAESALYSGALSIPPGPLGLVTILPDLLGVWRIQARMVADIAAVFGKNAQLTRETMIYCLFRHAASHAVKDLAVRAGKRIIFKRTSLRVIQKILKKIGLKITQRLAGRTLSRWLPIIGAIGVGAYAFYDTASVAKTAMELFRHDIEIEPNQLRQTGGGV